MDFPRAWEIARATDTEDHDPECSFRITKGAILCDCDVLMKHEEVVDDILQGGSGKKID